MSLLQIEVVLIDADGIHAEEFLPDTGELVLAWSSSFG